MAEPALLFEDGPRALSEAHDRALVAVDRATWETGEWATATQIAYEYDGRATGAGVFARKLWQLKDEALVEARDGHFPGERSPYKVVWGLTDLGGHAARVVADRMEATSE